VSRGRHGQRLLWTYVPFHFPPNALNIVLALVLPQPARGVRVVPILLFVLIMITVALLGLLAAIFALLWRFPSILDPSTWFPKLTSHRRLDENVSLLQLAEAFARRIERERATIAEKINDPEMIREVRRSLMYPRAVLNSQYSYGKSRLSSHPPTTPFWRCSIPFDRRIVCHAKY